MTMRTALVESRNVPAVRTLQAVGISRATKFLKGLGISQKSAYTLANGIGLYVSPLQIAASYAAFANGELTTSRTTSLPLPLRMATPSTTTRAVKRR